MKIGDTIWDFHLQYTGGGEGFRLSETAGRIVVLYFYPKDDTPGCTLEGRDFSALLPRFTAAGAVVYGVSRDDIVSHAKFREKHGYAHHLLADTESAVCRQFRALRRVPGIPSTILTRCTFVIGADGRLAAEWRDIKDAAGHAEAVLRYVEDLAGGGGGG